MTKPAATGITSWLTDVNDSSDQSGRLLSMEGMRGLAILLVFFVHYHALLSVPLLTPDTWSFRVSHALCSVGHAGVDLFFVISGFLIYGSVVRKPQPYFRFLRRRAWRIYPVFLTVMALYILLSSLFPQKSKIPADPAAAAWYLLENLFLLPGLITATQPMITVSWSLSYEFAFYLTVPVLVMAGGLRHWRPQQRALLVIALALFQFYFGFLPIRMVMFLTGMLVFEVIEAHWTSWMTPAVEWLILSLFVVSFVPIGIYELRQAWQPRMLVMSVSFTLFALACFRPETGKRGVAASVMSWKPLRFLGNISYSYYLLHALVLQGLALVISRCIAGPQPGLFWLLLPVSFAGTVMVSLVGYQLVEKRFSLGAVPAVAKVSGDASPGALVPQQAAAKRH